MSDKKYYLVDHEEVGGLRYGVLESDKPGSQLSWQHGHPNHGTLAMRRLIRDDDNVHVGTDFELVEVGSARDHEETERAKWIRNEGEPKGEDAGQFYVVSSKPGAPLNYAIRGLVAGGVYWSDKPPLRDSRYFFKSEREANGVVDGVTHRSVVKVGTVADAVERAKFVNREASAKSERQFYLKCRHTGWYGTRLPGGKPFWTGSPPEQCDDFFNANDVTEWRKDVSIDVIEVNSPGDRVEREAFAKREAEKSVVAVSDEQKAPATKRKPRTPEEFKAHLAAIKRLKRAADKEALDAFLDSVQSSFLQWVLSDQKRSFGAIEWPEHVMFSHENIKAATEFLGACGLKFSPVEVSGTGTHVYEVGEIE